MKKIYQKMCLGLLSFVLATVPVLATNWVQIGQGHYIDADSVKQSSSFATYTYNTKYLGKSVPLEKLDGHDIWTIKTFSYMDCRQAYAKTLSYTALDANERIVNSSKNIGKQWFGVNTPGSKGYESWAFICTDKYLHNYPGYNNIWWY